MEVASARAFGAVARDARAAAGDVAALNRLIQEGAQDAFAEMSRGAGATRRAMERIWDGFLRYFSSHVVRGLGAALGTIMPSPGGILGSLLGGFLSLFGLQRGGVVRGTREGRPFLLGENFTDELVVPLSRVALPAGAAAGAMPFAAPEVNVYQQFVIENRTPLEADIAIYHLAERGRLRQAARTLVPPPPAEVE